MPRIEPRDAVIARRKLMRARRTIRGRLRDAAALLEQHRAGLTEFTQDDLDTTILSLLNVAARLVVDPNADAYVRRTREGL